MTRARPAATLAAHQRRVPATGGSALDRTEVAAVDQTYLTILAVAALVAVIAALAIRQRLRREETRDTPLESPFATSTEGMKICPSCGMGNLWTDRNCISCGSALKG